MSKDRGIHGGKLMKVICVTGKARSGKDTVGAMIADYYQNQGERVLIIHYADMLKFILKEFYHWDGKKDEAGRKLLQRIGTDVVRAKSPDYWVNTIVDLMYLLEIDKDYDYVIIPDCRFPNEYEIMKEHHKTALLRVVAPEIELSEECSAHSSETSMDGYACDAYILNEKLSLGMLLAKIPNVINSLEMALEEQ